MKSVDKEKLRKIIMKNVRLFQLTIKEKKRIFYEGRLSSIYIDRE